jgi:GNAT superfamily N-acetyltransferase
MPVSEPGRARPRQSEHALYDPTMPVIIRPLADDEWETWREMTLAARRHDPDAFCDAYDTLAAQADAEWTDLVASTVAHPDGELLIAEVDGRTVGTAFCRIREDRLTVGIGSMWVAPEARRTGAGRALLEAAIAWGVARGAERADLWVTAGNGPAERMYRAAGFEPSGETGSLRAGSPLRIIHLERDPIAPA